jgi:NAD(P)-dependent dehydrogenase (short-subunit alcohol dehydrogenase family)
MRFKDKVLFTTGGGSGLARAVAQRFTREGGRVVITDFNAEAAKKTAAELDGALALQLDVRDEDAVVKAVKDAHRHFGHIDCAFPSAGIADAGPIEEWSLARWQNLFAVHVNGTFLACRELVPIMRKQGHGSIVTVASVAALIPQGNNTCYGAAKAAILMFSKQLAYDVAPDIRVNVIAPGSIQTGMTEPLYLKRGSGDLAKGSELASSRSVMKRVGQPDEIAAPVCHMLSDEASYVTGNVMVVDGGYTLT